MRRQTKIVPVRVVGRHCRLPVSQHEQHVDGGEFMRGFVVVAACQVICEAGDGVNITLRVRPPTVVLGNRSFKSYAFLVSNTEVETPVELNSTHIYFNPYELTVCKTLILHVHRKLIHHRASTRPLFTVESAIKLGRELCEGCSYTLIGARKICLVMEASGKWVRPPCCNRLLASFIH